MKKLLSVLIALMALGVWTVQAQTPAPISKWGSTSAGKAWPIKVTSATTAGNAQMGTGAAKPTGWATIRGGFDTTITATGSQAVIVSGQMEFVGGGGASAYTWLRYALTYQDSSTLNYKNTDTAAWISTKSHSGYEFDPISGSGTMANGSGGGTGAQGTVWLINNGNWNSNNSNGGGPISDVKNAPRGAVAIAGTYNWAISVQSINDTTNEIRWYLVEVNNKYWFGGTALGKATSKKFNGVNFGFNSDMEATQINFKNVTVGLGTPITVPAAPWQSFYVDQWGSTAQGKAWPIKNDSTFLVGDATLGTAVAKPTGWATVRGGFGDPVALVSGKAMTVSGQLQFIGGGGASAYTWLRYALTYQDSSTLSNKLTDTATWVSTKGNYGYEFDPISGAGTMANGAGGGTGAQGTAWLVNNGSWSSTNSNGGGPFSDVKNAPRNAVAIAGTYNWAISVQPINDTINEVRWSLVEVNNKYWFGGTVQTKATSKKFNGVNFGFNSDFEGTQVKILAVKVDMTAPITVPAAPWQAFYVEQWGSTAQGKAWPIKNDSTFLVGDATLGTGAAKPTGWATIRGGFGDPVALVSGKAMTVSGQMQFVGGGGASAYTWLRYALTYQDSSTLSNKFTDSATWVSTKGNSGYAFHPLSGAGTMSNGAGGQGTMWSVNNGSWSSTYSNNGGPISDVKNAPRNAPAIAGTYNWAISVQPINDTTNEVRWYLVEVNNKYWFGGTIQTKATSQKFNGVNFGFNSDFEGTQVKILAVKVDMGSPITVPTAPWQAFYIDQWGSTAQGKAWPVKNDSTFLVGDATLGTGAAVPTGWATIRGGFGDPVALVSGKALTVTGQMELVGGGGASAYTWMRYAFTYQDSSTLSNKLTDTAAWVSTKGNYGYEFDPISGAGTMANGAGGGTGAQGTAWLINNGSWSSTNSNGGGPFSDVVNAPRNAEAIAGIYNWAISVQPVNDTTNEVRWYLIEVNNKYWFGGTVQTKATAKKFNGVNFGFNSDILAKQVKLTAVKVDFTTPITVPTAPWQDFYVGDFGFIGGKIGGWKYAAGDFVGNANFSGTATNPSPVAVRASFGAPVQPKLGSALKITGSVTFVGGGFATAGSFKFGLFQTDSAGTLVKPTVPDSTQWNGKETGQYGYLFVPPTGTTGAAAWNNSTTGTWGGVMNGMWSSTTNANNYAIGSSLQTPANAVGGAGKYTFTIIVAPQQNGSQYVSYNFANGTSYVFAGEKKYDAHSPLASTKFNSMEFSLMNGNTTTAMNIADLQVAMITSPTKVGTEASSLVPKVYALMQNYPNPFNPSTKIAYDVPKSALVKITIFDLLGREVVNLIDGIHEAGSYSTQWNASNVGSGVYFYRIEATNQDGSTGFTAVKKLMLLK
jgi:hypothetical protein